MPTRGILAPKRPRGDRVPRGWSPGEVSLDGMLASMELSHMARPPDTSPAGRRILTRLRTLGPFIEGSLTVSTKRCRAAHLPVCDGGAAAREGGVDLEGRAENPHPLHPDRLARDGLRLGRGGQATQGAAPRDVGGPATVPDRAARPRAPVRPRSRPLSFADFELQAQGVALRGTLQALADFLDAHGELVTLVHQDLVRGLKRPQAGRAGLSAAPGPPRLRAPAGEGLGSA